MNLRRMASKIQMALCAKGVYIKINHYQHYNEETERMVTKYVLQETEKQHTGKNKSVTVFSSFQMSEVVKWLAKRLEESNT